MRELYEKHKWSDQWVVRKLSQAAKEIVADETTVCYFITENVTDEAFIQEIAEQLISSGCLEFHFFGKQERLWHASFDFAIIKTNHDLDDDRHAVTMGYDESDEFVEVLWSPYTVHDFAPTRLLLLYDDEEAYQAVRRAYAVCARESENAKK